MTHTPPSWKVDGAIGGGQIVRTAVAISALRGVPVRVDNIRRSRGNPGLQRQHLAAILAVERISGGALAGAVKGSSWVEFFPGAATGLVRETVDIGSAGSTMLVLQAALPLLARRGGTLVVTGGTDNPLAPPIDWFREILVPTLRSIGILPGIELVRRGFFPVGGGEISVSCPATQSWPGVRRTDWSGPAKIAGVAYSSSLPEHVPERIRAAALKELRSGKGLSADAKSALRACEHDVRIELSKGPSPGAGIVLWAADANGVRLGASALGERGKPSEDVGREAGAWLLAELAVGAPVDRHLADQLLVWAALASSPSEFRIAEATEHVRSCAQLLREGAGARIDIEGTSPAVVRVTPGGQEHFATNGR
ncbi:MAG: RNA 3'-terminal phosphate [Planctomycetota bacterium]|nr:MAG: RNA 3'-terminal phosphate [Planctomycetota bacterium]